MSAPNYFLFKTIRLPFLLLVGIAAALAFIHLGINLKMGKYSHLAISLVFWLAAASLIGDRRKEIELKTNSLSCGLGVIAILITLFMGAFVTRDLFVGFAPFTFAIGLALLASGVSNLLQYRRELIILLTLGIPKLLLPLLPDIAPITAKFSAFCLLYCGFEVMLQGNKIVLPQGAVEVVPSCSGLNLILYMLGLSVIFLVMFPLKQNHSLKVVSCLGAVIIGFLVNSVRVAILALLSGDGSRHAFEYWHSQEGALVFVTISVWGFQVFGQLVERVGVLLIGLGFIFLGERQARI